AALPLSLLLHSFLARSRHSSTPPTIPTRRSSDLIPRRHAGPERQREGRDHQAQGAGSVRRAGARCDGGDRGGGAPHAGAAARRRDRKSTRLNSSHVSISYAVFCLKKKM